MATLTGGSFKRISPEDIKVRRSTLNQLVDVIQEDVSGSATRKKYQVFVTGGVGPGVTSSLFQTVFDQDFSLQTANPIFDMTVGPLQKHMNSKLCWNLSILPMHKIHYVNLNQ